MNATKLDLTPSLKWLVFACEVAFLALAIWWGVVSDPPRDFDGLLSGWCGGIFALTVVCVSGCVVGLFFACGPEVLLSWKAVWGTIAAMLLVAAIFTVKYLAIGINMAGVKPSAERMKGEFAKFRSLSRGQREHQRSCDVELENGISVAIQCEVLSDLAYPEFVPVLFYRGNLFYWGTIDLPRPGSADDHALWGTVKDSNSAVELQAYLEQFPNGIFRVEARSRLSKVASAWLPSQEATSSAPAGGAKGLMAGSVFRDCNVCPDMVVVPAGVFVMGTPESEAGRDADEGPQRSVTITRAFAVAKFEVTRGQFAVFVKEAGYQSQDGNCWYNPLLGSKWVNDDPQKSWRNPGFKQTNEEPVVCVSWKDAKAYVAWLAQKTGKGYRLLTEAEWEYAARGGSETARPWGDDSKKACWYANVADSSFKHLFDRDESKRWNPDTHWCDDRSGIGATKVGSYLPNAFGLHDMIGNVSEFTEDCWNDSYAGAPIDGSARLTGDCSRRVGRGGGWDAYPRVARSAQRGWSGTTRRNNTMGLRVARTF